MWKEVKNDWKKITWIRPQKAALKTFYIITAVIIFALVSSLIGSVTQTLINAMI